MLFHSDDTMVIEGHQSKGMSPCLDLIGYTVFYIVLLEVDRITHSQLKKFVCTCVDKFHKARIEPGNAPGSNIINVADTVWGLISLDSNFHGFLRPQKVLNFHVSCRK